MTRGVVRSDGPLQWNHKIVIADVWPVAMGRCWPRATIERAIIGQSSTARFSFAWIYNAVEANAYATFGTATYNPLTVSVWGNEAARWTTGRARVDRQNERIERARARWMWAAHSARRRSTL